MFVLCFWTVDDGRTVAVFGYARPCWLKSGAEMLVIASVSSVLLHDAYCILMR